MKKSQQIMNIFHGTLHFDWNYTDKNNDSNGTDADDSDNDNYGKTDVVAALVDYKFMDWHWALALLCAIALNMIVFIFWRWLNSLTS